MDIINSTQKNGSRFVGDFVVPFAVLSGIIVVDHYLLRGATITPVCNFLAMGIFALYLRPRVMIFWAVCFTCSTLFMLNKPSFSAQEPQNKLLTTETRSTGAVVAAVIAVLLCGNRAKVARGHAQLAALVKRLPVPFVLSDKNGTLLYISEEAGHLMNIRPAEAAGQSYFSLLFNLSDKGAAIQRYVSLLDSEENNEASFDLRLLTCPDRLWRGTLMPVDLDSGRCLITVIEAKTTARVQTPASV